MKKLILTTSALTLVAGVAAAQPESSLGAEAVLKLTNWDGSGPAHFEQETTLTGTLSYGGAVSYGAEIEVSVDIAGHTATQGIFWLKGGFGKFQFGVDEFDNIENGAGDEAADIRYTFETNGLSLEAEVEAEVGNTAPMGNAWWMMAAYDGGSFGASLETQEDGWAEISANFDAGQFSVGGSVDNSTPTAWDIWASTALGMANVTATYDSDDVFGIEVDGDTSGVMWAFSWNTDDEITASLEAALAGISAGDVTIGVEYDSTNAGGVGDDAETVLTIGVPLADMLDLEILLNDANEYEASLTASFDL